MDWRLLDGVSTVAVSAGASAPEELVEELINACRALCRLGQRDRGGQGGRVLQNASDPAAARVVSIAERADQGPGSASRL